MKALDTDNPNAAYALRRAEINHVAMLMVGLIALVQSIAFCNMIVGGEPIYCRITDPAAKGLVYLFFVAFLAGYHVAIVFFAGLEAAYRERVGVAADPLARRSKFLIIGLNAATTLSAMAVYSANMFVNPQPELCAF